MKFVWFIVLRWQHLKEQPWVEKFEKNWIEPIRVLKWQHLKEQILSVRNFKKFELNQVEIIQMVKQINVLSNSWLRVVENIFWLIILGFVWISILKSLILERWYDIFFKKNSDFKMDQRFKILN